MYWTDIRIALPVEELEQGTNILYLVAPDGLYIEDYSDLTQEVPRIARVDLIDEELLARDRTRAVVHLYVQPGEPTEQAVELIREYLGRTGLHYSLGTLQAKEEDWANAWKSHYHAMGLSPRLAVCPSWETYRPRAGQQVIRLDPGMAFGTGTHETTRLCLRLLEDAVRPVCTVLDVGTGSGILAIAARLLGAGTVTGVDIDPVAVRAASENAARNNMEDIRLICGDLTGMLLGPFDVITANLTADILMRLAPGLPGLLKQDGFFICSGIIATRALEVRAALDGVGFEPTLALEENGWVAFSCRERS